MTKLADRTVCSKCGGRLDALGAAREWKRERDEARAELDRIRSDGITADAQDRILLELRRLVGGDPDYLIDGGGCDSGDPVDFTLAEIRMAFAMLEDRDG